MRVFDNTTPNLPLNWEDQLLYTYNGHNYGPCQPHSHSELGQLLETVSEIATAELDPIY
jgi:hypothetical protein